VSEIIKKKKNNERRITNTETEAHPQISKITIFFRASKIKFGLVDFHGLLARLAFVV
jgi:hypothetical protein